MEFGEEYFDLNQLHFNTKTESIEFINSNVFNFILKKLIINY